MIAKERDTEYYIDKARELAALIAANTDRINEQRKIPTDVSDEIADAGFFRLLMPRNLGGAQLDHPDFLRIVQIIAAADGSVGWSFNQNNVFATNSTRMNDKTREEIYSNPRAVITNGPPMSRSRAIEVDGGIQPERSVELQQRERPCDLDRCADAYSGYGRQQGESCRNGIQR